jgi:hypothetical protein
MNVALIHHIFFSEFTLTAVLAADDILLSKMGKMESGTVHVFWLPISMYCISIK